MLLAQAGCVFMGFILYISGAQGKQKSVCSLKGSSVDLPCSAEHPTSNFKWYTVHYSGSKHVQNELSADGNHMKYNISEKSNFTLTINDLRDNDTKNYCCSNNRDNPLKCWEHATNLQVTDLQVKVIPTIEGHTLTLMCSTSCRLTENTAAYTWYKNREFIYSDWSPWYQELVSSEEAATYSCAIKGYEDLRAPEVSVDSVTPACFSVTYAKGRMCSSKQMSVDQPCSITYPRVVHVQRTPAEQDHVRLTCNTSCPLTDPESLRWDKNSPLHNQNMKPILVQRTSADTFSCAVEGNTDLRSAQVCVEGRNCWSINYVSRRICALLRSSVNISSEYSHPDYDNQPKSGVWYKVKVGAKQKNEELPVTAGHVTFHDKMKNHTILTLQNLKKRDTAEYRFRILSDNTEQKQPDLPGVTLIVTGLTVKVTPSAGVTEGQTVTLTCSTSCPLTDNTYYIWYLNRRPVTLQLSQNKHLVLDPVSSQHAGNYSCAVKTHNITSSEKVLTVQSKSENWAKAVAGVVVVLLVLICITVFLWIRRKRTSSQSPRTKTADKVEQLNHGPLYEEVSAQSADHSDLHYTKIHFVQDHNDALYSTVQPHQPQEQDYEPYAVVNIRPKITPDCASLTITTDSGST
uniref:Uncharacterized LOC113128677 n=1 Tax=Mastacembelus armatus TaxID=205130 RepID=A0A7N9AX31_9TELE